VEASADDLGPGLGSSDGAIVFVDDPDVTLKNGILADGRKPDIFLTVLLMRR
jgi:hypothetical protein